MTDGKEIAVRVALRARPLVFKEIKEGAQNCLQFIPNEPQVIIGQDKAFTYDYVFPCDCKQEALYETAISDRIDYLFKGYNVTVLAYGQTGSGKTYTMGTAYSSSEGESEAGCGVIQRAVNDIFEGIKERSLTAEFLIKVSFLEVYNEDVFDLLQRNKDCPIPLAIREDQEQGIRITGLTEQPVTSPQETFQALELGTRSRTTASTAMNARSSRSHAIFTIILEQRALDNINDVTVAKFHLVDLAGSERAHKTLAFGDRFKEGVNINKGLLCLGNVISSLCENNSHIPYRDSKLTRLLQDSLGGNSHTIMIACVSPANSNIDETVNTLRYADRARKIKNKPIINRDPQNAELIELRKQVQMLQSQLLQGGRAVTTVKNEMTENEKQKYDENLLITLQRNKTLESENLRLAKELQHSLNQTTALCEKVIMAELVNDELIQELQKIHEETCQIIESLMQLSPDNPDLLNQLQQVKENQRKMVEITCNKLKKEAEYSMYSPSKKFQQNATAKTLQVLDDSPCYNGSSPSQYDANDEDELHVKSTLKQAQMTRELEALERTLAVKEQLAFKMQESDSQMTVMRIQYETNLKQMEEEIANLQREKEELLGTLKVVQTNNNHGKVSEMRRKQLQVLEAKIADMKKQIQEKSKLLKIKQDAERKVTKLQDDIRAMKTARIRLLKEIKLEKDRYQMLEKEKKREVANLKQKDRKREYQMVKLQQEFDKQKNVLKRKMEEAAAAKQRLNNALQQQKKVAERREKDKQQSVLGVGTRVQQWLSQEIEVVLRSRELNHHLQILLEDRKTITEQLEDLQSFEPPRKKKSLSNGSSDEESSLRKAETFKQINALEEELKQRNDQIADLQQKLLDLDQDEKNKHRWDTMQSMVEAKCAMKWLFDNVITAKMDCIIQEAKYGDKLEALENQIQQLRTQSEEIHREKDELLNHVRETKSSYEENIAKLIRENEDKTIYLLKQINGSKVSDNSTVDQNNSLMERIKFQEGEIERLSYLNDEIEKKNAEIESLKEQLHLARKGSKPKLLEKLRADDEDIIQPSPTVINRVTEMSSSMMKKYLESDISDSDCSYNDENDPDYRATPMYKRNKMMRKTISDPLDYETKKPKGPSGGCGCKISCVSKRCGCQKQERNCSGLCKCIPEKCCNRDSEMESSVRNFEGKDISNSTFTRDSNASESDSFYQNMPNNTTMIISKENEQNNENVFICPVLPVDVKKHIYEENISLNNSGVNKQSVFRPRLQRYFPLPEENMETLEN